jgi:hypothetical protein
MHPIQFNYSLKNIGLPSKDQYRRRLIEKVESVVQRMRPVESAFLFERKQTYNIREQVWFAIKKLRYANK